MTVSNPAWTDTADTRLRRQHWEFLRSEFVDPIREMVPGAAVYLTLDYMLQEHGWTRAQRLDIAEGLCLFGRGHVVAAGPDRSNTGCGGLAPARRLLALYSRISDHIIMVDEMALADAAQILGVTPRQAQRLAAGGELGHTRRVGRTVVVASTAVYRAQNNGTTSKGRPALPGMAWFALYLLAGGSAQGQREEHLAARLAAMSPIQVARFARRRARVTQLRFVSRRAQRGLPDSLIAAGLHPTGLMSPLVTDWGLAGGRSEDVIDGYLYLGTDRTLRDLGLQEEPGGRISLRILEEALGSLPASAVALDLMESMDSRVRTVGRDRLSQMIAGLR